MAWIPPDPAVRVRLLQADTGKAPVLPIQAVQAASANLPDLQNSLQPGERFTARIQQALPEINSYRATVGDKEVALQLPGNAKPGDVLELVVVESNPRLIRAQLASAANAAATTSPAGGENAEAPQLSTAAQLIGKLLPPAGTAPPSVPLNHGAPLLPAAPGGVAGGIASSAAGSLSGALAAEDIAAMLASRLAQAASQSGLFYEAHQAQWLTGKHSTEALMKEPQAQHAPPQTAASLAAPAGAKEVVAANVVTNASPAEAVPAAKDLLQSIPAELRPLVQQQLDAAASQRLAWHGEVWPGQTMEWQVNRDGADQSAPQQETAQWQTSLALTTPGLGRIEAALGISGNALRIQLSADNAVSAATLTRRLPALQVALQAAGLRLTGLQVVQTAAESGEGT